MPSDSLLKVIMICKCEASGNSPSLLPLSFLDPKPYFAIYYFTGLPCALLCVEIMKY